MALVDDIEFYGHAADIGDMTREEAILALTVKNPGSLTRVGAAHSLANWQSVRSQFEQVFENAAQSLNRMIALNGAIGQ